MAKLYFKVGSDWEEVVRLREEITKLQSQLKTMDANKAPAAVATLNRQVNEAQLQMRGMVNEAAKAAVVVGDDLKSKIYKGSQAVNDFTQKIIDQKAVVKDVEADVRKLTTAYNNVRRNPLQASSALAELNGAKRALNEEKSALFGLTQEQSKARLSVRKLKDEYALYGTQVKDSTSSTFSFVKALGLIGGISALKRLGSQIINVRSQFRTAEVSLETMVGEEKAKDLLAKTKQYAKISPLEFMDIQSSTEMMIGFNIEAEKVPRYIEAIGDISRGNSQKFQSLSLAFSQMSAAGKLMGQDLNQMINAGFNPLQFIAEKTGKTIAQLKDEMSKGAISAEMVQKAFIDATSAGGKFYGMSQKQSEEVAGQMSILSDTIANKLNEIGESNEGLIKTGIKGATALVDNYEIIGKAITTLVATYGTYKAALVLSTLLEDGGSKALWGKIKATKAATAAQATYDKVLLMNPYVAVAAGIVALGIALYTLSDHTSEAEIAQRKFNETSENQKKVISDLKSNSESLISTIKSETSTQYDKIKAYRELQALMPSIFANMDIEKIKTMEQIELDKKRAKGINIAERVLVKTSAVLRQNELNEVTSKLNKAVKEQAESPSGQRASVIDKLQKQKLEAEEAVKLANKAVEEIEKIQSESDKKSKTTTTYKQDLDKAKKDWEDAKKELAKIEKDKDKFTSKQYENAKKRSESAEKTYKDLGGVTGSGLAKEETKAEKLRKETDKYNLLLSKQALDEKRTTEDLQMSVDEARIKAMDEGSKKTIAQMELNFEKEMQAVDRQKEDALRKKIDKARSAFEADPKNKGQVFDSSGIALSDDETKMYDSRYKAAIASFEKEQAAFNQKSKDAWNNYLREWGTVMEKRKAITESYSDKIAKADTEGEKESLKKQMQTELSNIDFSQLKQSINWEAVFGNLSLYTKKQLQAVKKQLVAFKNSPEFKNSTPEQMKVIEEAINNLNTSISDKGGLFDGVKSSFDEYRYAVDRVTEAQKKLEEALKSGDKAAVEKAQKNLQDAQNSKVVAKGNVTKSKNKAIVDITAITNAVTQLGQADVSLTNIGNTIGTLVGVLSESGDATGQIIAATLALLDQIGEKGLNKLVGNIVESSWHATGGVLDSVGEIFGIKGLGGIYGGADYSSYNEMVAQYDRLNDIWDELIASKEKYIKISYGEEAYKASKEAEELIYKSIESYRTLGVERLNAGASTGSHSIGVRQRKRMDSSDWEEAKKALGSAYNSSISDGRMTGLFELSVEQLEKLKSEAPTFWAKLDDEVREYLNSIIKGQERIEEMEETLKESLTGVSFDSFFEGMLDSLYDVETTYKDISDDMSEYIRKSLIKAFVIENYKDDIRKWYDMWAKSLEDGKISSDEQKALDDLKSSIITGAVESAKLINDQFDTATSSQSSTSKGFQAMSQDTGDELSGRFAALQIDGEEGKTQLIQQTALLTSIDEKMSFLDYMKGEAILPTSDVADIANQNRTIISNSYQPQINISFPTDKIDSLASDIFTMRGIIDEMRSIQIEHIPDIAGNVAKVVKNSPKMNDKLDSINDNIKRVL